MFVQTGDEVRICNKCVVLLVRQKEAGFISFTTAFCRMHAAADHGGNNGNWQPQLVPVIAQLYVGGDLASMWIAIVHRGHPIIGHDAKACFACHVCNPIPHIIDLCFPLGEPFETPFTNFELWEACHKPVDEFVCNFLLLRIKILNVLVSVCVAIPAPFAHRESNEHEDVPDLSCNRLVYFCRLASKRSSNVTARFPFTDQKANQIFRNPAEHCVFFVDLVVVHVGLDVWSTIKAVVIAWNAVLHAQITHWGPHLNRCTGCQGILHIAVTVISCHKCTGHTGACRHGGWWTRQWGKAAMACKRAACKITARRKTPRKRRTRRTRRRNRRTRHDGVECCDRS